MKQDKPKYEPSKSDLDYIDRDNKITKELFHFYLSDPKTHKIVLASLYGTKKEENKCTTTPKTKSKVESTVKLTF